MLLHNDETDGIAQRKRFIQLRSEQLHCFVVQYGIDPYHIHIRIGQDLLRECQRCFAGQAASLSQRNELANT